MDKLDHESADTKAELLRLREREAHLRFISENLAQGMVYQIDSGPDGRERRFTYLSPAVERMHGIKLADALADASLIYNQVREVDRALMAAREAEAVVARKRFEFDTVIHLPGGEQRNRSIMSAPRLCPGGRLLWDGIEFDTTESRRLERSIGEAYDLLQRRALEMRDTCEQLRATARALRESQRRLKRLAQEDTLTGLLNRRGFFRALYRAKALAERHGQSMGFLVLDIDHFKQINDQYGHVTGDRVLKGLAGLLLSCLRPSDLACRHGGDEILIALMDADAEVTRLKANRIIEAVREHKFSKGHARIHLTVSIGAACAVPVARQSLDPTLELADQALYCAKRNGKNTMVLLSLDENQALTGADGTKWFY